MAKKYSQTMKNRDDFTRAQTAFFGLANSFVHEVGVRKISIIGGLFACIILVFLGDWFLFQITLLCTVLIVAFELMNSALEELADYVQPEKSPQIKRVKDIAAGAVFLVMISSVVFVLLNVATDLYFMLRG